MSKEELNEDWGDRAVVGSSYLAHASPWVQPQYEDVDVWEAQKERSCLVPTRLQNTKQFWWTAPSSHTSRLVQVSPDHQCLSQQATIVFYQASFSTHGGVPGRFFWRLHVSSSILRMLLPQDHADKRTLNTEAALTSTAIPHLNLQAPRKAKKRESIEFLTT